MPIKSNIEKHTVSWLKSQDSAGLLNKNISIQRKEVWYSEKKSNLIVSLLLDIPIESLLFEESGDTFNVLDGKQRTLTLCSFVADGFKLSPKIRIKEIGGHALEGLTFSELPKKLQNNILEYELSIAILRQLDSEERATVFFMRNQAVCLSKMDLSLVVIGEKAMNTFAELCNHEFLRIKIKLTEPARRKHDDLQILLQTLILWQRPDMGFSGTEIMNFCDDIKNGEAELDSKNLLKVLNYLDSAFEEKRQYLKKTHVPIVIATARVALEKKIKPESFKESLDNFFENLEPYGVYMQSCKSGSSKRANVQTRLGIMSEIVM